MRELNRTLDLDVSPEFRIKGLGSLRSQGRSGLRVYLSWLLDVK